MSAILLGSNFERGFGIKLCGGTRKKLKSSLFGNARSDTDPPIITLTLFQIEQANLNIENSKL